MSQSFSLIIRDGTPADIEACLKLDHSYETDQVLQMRIEQDQDKQAITFATERLPRTMDVLDQANVDRIQYTLEHKQGFIVAVESHGSTMLGYATIISDPVYHFARVHDLVITRSYRRQFCAS